MDRAKRIVWIIFLSLCIVLSCTVAGNRFTSPAAYSHTIEVLDASRSTVLGLSAASAAASAAMSALPDDICSPLAQEISEFTTWFLLILSVIYLEKYLLPIFGFLACYLLIPGGCGMLLVNCFFPRKPLKSFGVKLVIFAFALLLVIPASAWISDQINAVYEESIEITVESAAAVTENLFGEAPAETEEDGEESTTVIDEAKTLLGDVSGSVAGVVEQFKNVLNRFIEAVAVMLVTTCLIPILVVLFFGWIVKVLFNTQIIHLPDPPHFPPKAPRRESRQLPDGKS